MSIVIWVIGIWFTHGFCGLQDNMPNLLRLCWKWPIVLGAEVRRAVVMRRLL